VCGLEVGAVGKEGAAHPRSRVAVWKADKKLCFDIFYWQSGIKGVSMGSALGLGQEIPMRKTIGVEHSGVAGLIKSAVLMVLVLVSGWVTARAQEAYSHARVVRLSFTEGTVTILRPDVSEWSTAPANTPIQEGYKLSTGESSFAEVQFENAESTARIGQNSEVAFTQLALDANGGRISRVAVTEGYASFNFHPENGEVFQVIAGNTTLDPQGKCQFRVDFDQQQLRVEVFKGSVEASTPQGSTELTKNRVLQFDASGSQPFDVAQGIEKDEWDKWVHDRDQQLSSSMREVSGSGYPGSMYGFSDLTYYGDWGYVPGYGNAWFPGAGSGWAPYTLGNWAWYPGFGYTWISAEPWGWLPFHYGGWGFDPAYGWFWMPGGFNTWSPGLVTWYQGPGWIGWQPRSLQNHPLPANCAPGRACMAVVSNSVFQSGRTVTPKDVISVVNLAEARGQQVARPDIAPTPQNMLVGQRVAGSAALLSRTQLQRIQVPGGGVGVTPRVAGAVSPGATNPRSPVYRGSASAPVRGGAPAAVPRSAGVPRSSTAAPRSTVSRSAPSGGWSGRSMGSTASRSVSSVGYGAPRGGSLSGGGFGGAAPSSGGTSAGGGISGGGASAGGTSGGGARSAGGGGRR
jgi:hypothetical protein